MPSQRSGFCRLLNSWYYYTEPGDLAFIDGVQPEAVQVGFYRTDFWALAHVPKELKGKTASTQPVGGDLQAGGEYLVDLNGELHRRDIKVIGHFDIGYHLTGVLEGSQGAHEGFVKLFNELWNENEMGPKPVKDPGGLLTRHADGTPIARTDLPGYSAWPLYHGCLNNPNLALGAQSVREARHRAGVDGFVANYFYTYGCLCRHCVRGFEERLRALHAQRTAAAVGHQ